MFNTISNLSRKSDKYGDIHFISFLGATLSRLAYLNDNKFLNSYSSIMGPVIQPKILQGINSVDQNNLSALLDDQTIFGLDKSQNDIFSNYEYQYKGKNFIDFVGLNMPQNVNIINGDIKGNTNFPVPGQPTTPDMVKYISIGWSNYGEIYVVADKRMPNTLFLIFRGTYSAKTAALYSKPSSIVPITACKQSPTDSDQYLYGIFKATSEMLHTIVETMRYLATSFLGATAPNSVKIFTTGHSLGGAMCTNFAYLWMNIKKTSPYNAAPYNVLADNIVCVSLGAPRCMGSSVASKFCNYASQKKILYLRITTRGDPVPAVPPKTGFQHPCSGSNDSAMRMEISEDCNATLTMRPIPNVNYTANLDCQNYKTRAYIPNPLSHTIYLDIMYTNAVDIAKFFKGIGIAQEVSRAPDGSTVCRLVMGQTGNYKVVFFNVNLARDKPSNVDAIEDKELSKPDPNAAAQLAAPPTNGGGWGLPSFGSKSSTTTTQPSTTQPSTTQPPTTQPSTTSMSMPKFNMPSMSKPSMSMPKLGGQVAEDNKMTLQAFNSLIERMVPLQGNLCPQTGQLFNPFNNQIMPNLSCPSNKLGGKRKNKRTKKNKKSKRRNTRKH